eukprot:TRINITY_DN16825_c0_g1_i1.p1 TRINITY_DN16825_c0_g1~~TRINITY_DN16825_c0_g1_i1.p1  ORF type:complete len:803 (-),score=57.09 TRINITY_DN16825_c0_g1_i1:47-2455(-)
MSALAPSSPALAVGQRAYWPMPQSPSLSFRGTSAASVAGPVGSLGASSSAPAAGALANVSAMQGCPTALAARHTKSATDLGTSRSYLGREPTRITGGKVRGASPTLAGAYRELRGLPQQQRTYTPYVPTQQAWRSSSPPAAAAIGSTPPLTQKQARTLIRGSSVERRSPQWTTLGAASSEPSTQAPSSPTITVATARRGAGGSHILQPWSMASSPSQQLSPRLTSTQSSQHRSPSQSNQVYSGAGASFDVRSARGAPPTVDIDRGSRSPSQNAAQRAPSYQHLHQADQPQAGTQHESVTDEQMASRRNSLLQNIRSVQREITRLELERQKKQTQPTFTTGVTASSVTAVPQQASHKPFATGMVAGSPAVASNSRRAPGITAADTTPIKSAAQSKSRPEFNAISAETFTTLEETEKSQSLAAQSGAVTYKPPVKLSPATTSEAAKRSAAMKIQGYWRRLLRKRPRFQTLKIGPKQSNGARRAPVHHAAARIQRAWRISRWRRSFVRYSERSVGWVGTLDWLQHHNLLYGTELADPEDVNWWEHQRANAPLDRDVDPWGSAKLRDHLNKMWYGRTTEELELMQAAAEQEQRMLEEQSRLYDESLAAYSMAQLGAQAAYASKAQAHTAPLANGSGYASNGAVTYNVNGGYVFSQASAAVPASARAPLRSPAPTDRSMSHRPQAAARFNGKSTSLSPRRETRWTRTVDGSGAKLARSLLASGAPPPSSMQSAQSPLMTHRAARTSATTSLVPAAVPAPQLSPMGLRPRSPVQSSRVQSATLQSARLSLPGHSLRPVTASAVASARR